MISKTITSLKTNNGSIITNNDDLLKEQVKYYEQLYQKDRVVNPVLYDKFMNTTNVQKLNETEKDQCEGELTVDECENVIKEMAINKSPGYDGLTAEFYKHFWQNVKYLVVGSLNEGFDKGIMASSHRRGIITLIHKGKELSRENLSNWRPITLVNVDYKIATKALAKRLQNVISSIIDTDQSGYIKGRYIGENARMVEDVIRFTEKNNTPGALLFLDFSKAFDNLDRQYLMNVLKVHNFGKGFLKWIDTIYNETSSCIIQNGNVSNFFVLEKGVRQGCPFRHYYLSLDLRV